MRVLYETPRLVIRRVMADDVETLLAIYGDPENTRFYGSGQPWSREEVERMLADYPFADARLISEPGIALMKPALDVVGYGGVGYFLREDTTPDLLFILKRAYWGRGLATELAQAAIAAAFGRREITTIYAIVHPLNRASIGVLKKSGLRFDRALPERDRLLYRIDRAAS